MTFPLAEGPVPVRSTSRPAHDLEAAVMVLDDRSAALNPVAGIDVADAGHIAQRRVVDVAADHTVGVVAMRFRRQICSKRPMKLTAFLTRSFAQAESDQ